MRKQTFFLTMFAVISAAILAVGCSSSGTSNGGTRPPEAKQTVSSVIAGNGLSATIASFDGTMHRGKQSFTISFVEGSGKTVDVGSVALNFRMPAMGSMAEMNAGATLTKTDKPGVYNGVADFSMVGDWDGQVTYEGAAGKGSCVIPVVVK